MHDKIDILNKEKKKVQYFKRKMYCHFVLIDDFVILKIIFTNVLKGNKDELNYEKSWYCGVCKKLIKELDNRFQRECNLRIIQGK